MRHADFPMKTLFFGDFFASKKVWSYCFSALKLGLFADFPIIKSVEKVIFSFVKVKKQKTAAAKNRLQRLCIDY